MTETPEPTHQTQNPSPNFTISEHSTPSMANTGEGSSANAKPVIVRVKRKAFQSLLEAFWLEINERPLKRPLLDLEKLSISDSSGKEEVKTKKVLVQHLETVSTSEAAYNILQSFAPNSDGALDSKTKSDERRHTFKKENIQDQLLVKARQEQEILAKNARFEQIWRSRKGKNEAAQDKALHEMCHLYDVVRVDVEETSSQVQEDMSLEDQMILCNYLPLIRDFIPSAAAEIESDIHAYMSKQASPDEYVYDLYAVKDDMNITDEDALNPFPLVQVDEDDEFYAGPPESEFESDDSNAEDNPLNDYPDEEASEDEEDSDSRASDDESGEPKSDSASDRSLDSENLVQLEDEINDDCENESDCDSDDDDGDGDVDDNTEDWRWSYR